MGTDPPTDRTWRNHAIPRISHLHRNCDESASCEIGVKFSRFRMVRPVSLATARLPCGTNEAPDPHRDPLRNPGLLPNRVRSGRPPVPGPSALGLGVPGG